MAAATRTAATRTAATRTGADGAAGEARLLSLPVGALPRSISLLRRQRDVLRDVGVELDVEQLGHVSTAPQLDHVLARIGGDRFVERRVAELLAVEQDR